MNEGVEYCPIRPDWRDPSCYPAPNELSLDAWAWEFLRRNPEYCREYRHFDSLPDSSAGLGVKNGKWKGGPCREHTLDNFYTLPPAQPGEVFDAYQARMMSEGHDDWTILPFAEYLTSKYKIEPVPLNPDAPLGAFAHFSDVATVDSLAPWVWYFTDPQEMSYYAQRLRPGSIVIEFDINQPIDDQLQRAKESLLDIRDVRKSIRTLEPVKSFKPQKAKFPTYVRLLDAEATGAAVPEMASVLYPQETNTHENDYRVSKKVRLQLAAAIQLRDSDYWKIAAR